jgi:amino acid adenylation domain-containing protein/non-ribosomal peptide synthase protein (TIGR01720 family)
VSRTSTLHGLFEAQALRRPDAVAITCSGRVLTYAQADELANRLAARLLRSSGSANALFAIAQERSDHLLISMLAILKAGGAFVPMDPASPDQRLEFLLRDTQVAGVLTDGTHGRRLAGLLGTAGLDGCQLLEVDGAGLDTYPGERLDVEVADDSLAYVIYTSGTSGKPKGVQIEHRSVTNYVRNAADRLGLSATDICDFSTNPAFDLTITTTLACLALGGQVAVYDGSVQDLFAYRRFLADSGVTFAKLTPGYFGLLADVVGETHLTTVVLGGEKLSPEILRKISTRTDQHLVVYDEYGPTEATVGTSRAQVYPLARGAQPTIGTLYDGYTGYVLDERGQPVAAGELGELFIGGVGVARGYLNRPDLTAERFVIGPDGKDRVYRTGDLVRWLPDGTLEYVGRNDDQVKIRGFRVEPGEIAEALATHGDVAQAVVVAHRNDRDSRTLTAYVVAGEFGCSQEELEQHLAGRLPDYLRPSGYVFVDTIPLTPNGKVDRAALPAPRQAGAARGVPPRTDLERQVCETWSELLRPAGGKVGITDSFFTLGGDSIVAIQLISRLRSRLAGRSFSVNDVLTHDTVEEFCAHLTSQASTVALPAVLDEERGGPLPLLPIQNWFFANEFARPGHWNQAFLIRTPALDLDRLRAAVHELNHHHGAFGLRYHQDETGCWQQRPADRYEPPELVVASLRTSADPGGLEDLLTDWQADFDLAEGPLHRIGYVDGFGDGTALVFVAAHHLVVDAISWRVLADDLSDLYHGRPLNRSSSIRQWTGTLERYGDEHDAERNYWHEVLDDYARTGDAALRSLAGQVPTQSAFELDSETTGLLLRRCNQAFHTQINDILLTAFARALTDVTGQSVHHVVLEGHGREHLDPLVDLTGTVGWFTTMFPVRLDGGADHLAGLRANKEHLRAIPAKGIGYGVLFGYRDEDLPPINFNYLGQFDTEDTSATSWQITRDPAGKPVHPDNQDPYLVTVNGWVIDGRLHFTIASKLPQQTGDLVADRFGAALRALIADLSAREGSVLTASDIDYLLTDRQLDDLQVDGEVEDVFRANSLQQGFIQHAVGYGRTDDSYTVQLVWTYRTAIDPIALRTAWQHAQARFAALRLRFAWPDELVQVIDARAELDWLSIDLGGQPPAEQDEAIRKIRAEDRAEPYDLRAGALFRVRLIRRSATSSTLLFSAHHSILDGWSNTILLDHVHETYDKLVAGVAVQVEPERTYAAVQRHLQKHLHDHDDFWQDYLARYDEKLELQGLLSDEAKAAGARIALSRVSSGLGELYFAVEGADHDRLREVAQQSGITPNALLLYIWHRVLGVFGGSAQTCCGVVVSGRGVAVNGIDEAVGLVINTLPLVVRQPDPAESLLDGVRAVQRQVTELNERSTVDLASLHQGDSRLFDTLFIYENWPKLDRHAWQRQLKVEFEGEYEKLDYPLSVIVSETPAGLTFRLSYSAELFDAALVEQLLRTQQQLLAETLEKLQQPWAALRWPSTASVEVAEETVAEDTFTVRFEAQVRRTPDEVAVVAAGTSLTYRELNLRANKLAHYLLRELGVRAEEPVLVCTDRSAHLVTAMLAVAKAGAAYVHIDAEYPEQRLAYLLADTATRVVLTTGRYADRLASLAGSATVVTLDTDPAAAANADNPIREARPAELLYVLYTSGTTGKPKGVMVEHRQFVALLDGVRATYFADRDRISTFSLTNQVFDIFGLEYGLPLLTGGTVELGAGLPERVDCQGLDFLQLTPSVGELLLDRLTGLGQTLLLLGGEKLDRELLDRALDRGLDVVNVYGPTETTIWSTSRLYRSADRLVDKAWGVSLGAAFPGEFVQVLDDCLRPVPAGAVGELFIGGAGLARGYLGKEELTAERFVRSRLGERLYRTGDRVRLRLDGELEFLGRTDSQVKLRGHRVELGEIEVALQTHPAVRQCAVEVKQLGDGLLVAYYTADDELVDPAAYLRKLLPVHLVPGAYVRLPDFPLTHNGKLDRAALPDPMVTTEIERAGPRSELDSAIRDLLAAVLGREAATIGIDDDFFGLGGNSISSVRLVTALHRELGLEVGVAQLFESRTVRGLAELAGSNESSYPEITAGTAGEELSFAQERLWFIEQFEGGTTAYNLPLVLQVHDDVATEVLAEAVNGMLRDHEVLRTMIRQRPDGTGYQCVQDLAEVPADLPVAVVLDQAAFHAGLRAELDRPFDLAAERPVRLGVYRVVETGRRYLWLVIHHIAFDGWSIDVLLEDLRRRCTGAVPAPLPVQYRDFAAWQRARLDGERAALLDFWTGRLRGFENLDLITDRPRPERADYRGDAVTFAVDADTSRRLRELSQGLELSLFSVLLSGFYLTLRCFTGQDDLVVGTPLANRDHPQLDRLIGFFVNTLPVRSRVDPAEPLAGYLRRTAADVIDVLNHQELPFEQLVDALDVSRDAGRHPIYQVVFGLQSFGATHSPGLLSVADETTLLYRAARFDLSTSVDDSGPELAVEVNYATSLFDRATMHSFTRTYAEVLRQLVSLPSDATLADLSWLDAEAEQVISDWSLPSAVFESDATLHGLFEQQVADGPDRIALTTSNGQRTYAQLNGTANRLAHQLIEQYGVQPDDLVVLCLDRGEQIVSSILATLKAGAAYVPVEPSFPDERIAFILRDTGAATVVTQARYAARFEQLAADAPQLRLRILTIDTPLVLAQLDSQSEVDPVTAAGSDHLAYVLFTSGTTGRPKGVPQTHGNVVRLFTGTESVYGLRPDDVWTLFHSYVFDFTVWEIWGPLLYGGRLVVPTLAETRDPLLFHQLCQTERVTVLCQTPTAFYPFMEVALAAPNRLTELRYVFFGGEALNVSLLKPWFAAFPDDQPQLAAGYGTTETTVFTCYKLYGQDDISSTDIGPLLLDVAGHVLDRENRPVPIGAVGQLHIGGAGLTPAYLNRPELTAEKFIPDPFQNGQGRLYRSGDLVRWRPDGNLEFVRRNDQQVKVRGHRIELGEIETALSGHPEVRQCTVVARRRTDAVGETYLVGYYVSERPVGSDELLARLRSVLPEYMIPVALMPIPALPRTVSGKLDLQQLPEPTLSAGIEFVAPRNEREAQVRAVWAQVLGVDEGRLGVHDDFFRLGGNSILSIKLIARLQRDLGAAVSIATVFKYPTVAQLAASSSAGTMEAIPRLAAVDESRQVLSFAQERLWFVDQYEQSTSAYNICLCYEVLEGTDLDLLERAVQAVVARHEVLRTVIARTADGDPYQRVLDLVPAVERIVVPDEGELSRWIRQDAGRRFDLAADVPFEARFYVLPEAERVYVEFLVHHLAFDGWSADLLLSDVGTSYAALAGALPDDAVGGAELTIQYRDFAAWERERLNGERLAGLLAHWISRVANQPVLRLVPDRPRPAVVDYRGGAVSFTLDRELSAGLRALAGELDVSLFSVLLSAWYLMLSTYSGQRSVVVGIPALNRQHPQTHDLIGCFVNSLALDYQVDPAHDAEELIRGVADRVRTAQQYQDLPFDRLVSALGAPRDPSRHPVFQVWFDVHSFGRSDAGDVQGAPLRPYAATDVELVTRFDLSADLDDAREELSGSFIYAVALFDEATVEGYLATFTSLLAGFVGQAPGDESSRSSVLASGSGPELDLAGEPGLAERFRSVAEKSPAAVAVVYGDEVLTYGELALAVNGPAGSGFDAVVDLVGSWSGSAAASTAQDDLLLAQTVVASARYHLGPENGPRVLCQLAASPARMPLALANGHRLVLVPDHVRDDPQAFVDYLIRQEVTDLDAVGNQFGPVDLSQVPSLTRGIVSAGQTMTLRGEVTYEYGLAETSGAVLVHDEPGLVLGRPAAGWHVTVVDESLRVLPIGAVGELVVTTRGVSAIRTGQTARLRADGLVELVPAVEMPVRADRSRRGRRRATRGVPADEGGR